MKDIRKYFTIIKLFSKRTKLYKTKILILCYLDKKDKIMLDSE